MQVSTYPEIVSHRTTYIVTSSSAVPHYPGVVRVPTLVRILSSADPPHCIGTPSVNTGIYECRAELTQVPVREIPGKLPDRYYGYVRTLQNTERNLVIFVYRVITPIFGRPLQHACTRSL